MKCANCSSQMFITDEAASTKSSVTFYRCSICISEHVSSEPVLQASNLEQIDFVDTHTSERKRYLMV